jgi:glutamate synthase (NADPH/NADH) large chain/glutamate synthase (ferredoxin)
MTISAEKLHLEQQGLYAADLEHDACGVGFVAHMRGAKSHDIVTQALKILENLDHRGAVGADKLMGDGAGILIQLPDTLYREEMAKQGIELPLGFLVRRQLAPQLPAMQNELLDKHYLRKHGANA